MKSILFKRRFDGTDTLKSVTPTLDVPSLHLAIMLQRLLLHINTKWIQW